MISARGLSIVAAVCLASTTLKAAPPEPASGPEVAAALKKLESARAQLNQAVHRIETDPPANADLEAAHMAVGALKDAIDAGAAHESKDLDLAKAMLAARKELRTHRAYVDQRRANVHIHRHRRETDAQLAKAKDAVRLTSDKNASPAAFQEARTAVAALKAAADQGRPFIKDDPAFAKYISDVDSTVAQFEKDVDDRWTLLAVNKHRAALEEARQSLASALTSLSKDGTDAQFDTADRAAVQLNQKLDEGKVFESRDKAYKAEAEKARAEFQQSKRKLEALLGTTALNRLKAEIEPAHRDLISALATLRKKPNEEQLAEAKTAAIVVRKLVEKFQPQADHSPAFGQYVDAVKTTLVEVEVELQKRTLDSARAEVTQALRGVEKTSATDEQFQELNTALTILEKTLEMVHQKDPALAKPVADARALLRDARARGAQRRYQVDLATQRAKIQEIKRSTEATVREIQQPNIGEETLLAAQTALKTLKTALDEGAPFVKKDSDYAKFDSEVKERIRELGGRIAIRRILLSASLGRTKLTESIADVRSKIDTAQRPDARDEDLDAAGKSLEALGKLIESQAPIEKQDKGYASSAEKARNQLYRQSEALELARPPRELRRQTGEAFAAGTLALGGAAGAQDLKKKKELYEKAVRELRACEKDGHAMLRSQPDLSKVVVLVDGAPELPAQVIARCTEKAAEADPQLRHVTALIAFEDGPKKSFVSAKGLLASAKKSEALQQLDECVSSGRIAQYKYPELKERKFDISGREMTIGELIDQCVSQRKSIPR